MPDLEVRQVDVHQTVHEFETVQRVEAACIVDDGQLETEVAGMKDAESDLWDDVFGCDQIDVVDASYVLQLDVPLSQLFWRQ